MDEDKKPDNDVENTDATDVKTDVENSAEVKEAEAIEEAATTETAAVADAEGTGDTDTSADATTDAKASESLTARRGVPEVANKSDYVEPGTWQAEAMQKSLAKGKPVTLPPAASQTSASDKAADTEPKPKASIANQVPVDEADILAAEKAADANYHESDVFAWANNLVQYKDELKIEMFLFNKNYVLYRTARKGDLDKQMEPIFVDGLLEHMLEGAEQGLIVRGFEEAESEENVLQRTRVSKVEKLREVLGWLKSQEHEIELFNEEEHDIKRIKGVVARCSHPDMKTPFYVIKALPQSQVMKGKTSWMLRGDKFVPFDADAALRIPDDNQLLVLDQDLYVFSQPKLKALFGYDAKEAAIAESKVREIEQNFRLSFAEGMDMQSLLKGKKATIKKLQKVEPSLVKQEDMMEHGEELGVGLMQDDAGAIIIMDDKDLTRFVNLLNDDYMESAMTGLRYEIVKKRELKPPDEDELLKQVL